MTTLGVSGIPSQYIIKNTLIDLHTSYGIRTIRYQGMLGHIYYVNDFLQLITQVNSSLF